jgi:hypothetical protein
MKRWLLGRDHLERQRHPGAGHVLDLFASLIDMGDAKGYRRAAVRAREQTTLLAYMYCTLEKQGSSIIGRQSPGKKKDAVCLKAASVSTALWSA